MKNEEQREKLRKLEQLVDADLSNGRHMQKKIKARLQKLGLCEKDFVQEIAELKSEG